MNFRELQILRLISRESLRISYETSRNARSEMHRRYNDRAIDRRRHEAINDKLTDSSWIPAALKCFRAFRDARFVGQSNAKGESSMIGAKVLSVSRQFAPSRFPIELSEMPFAR